METVCRHWLFTWIRGLVFYEPINVLPHLPPTGKRGGFDLILTAKHAPDQRDLINIYK